MYRNVFRYSLLSLVFAVGGCYSSTDGGGPGGSAGLGGSGGDGDSGGTGSCTSSGTVAFEYAGFGAEPDCVVPGVCIARGRVKGICNSASELIANTTA